MKKLFIAAVSVLAFSSARAQGPVTTPPTQDDKQAEITFETTVKDFGTIPEGPDAVYVFKFKNTGTAPLILSSVQPSCGCTTPEWSKEPVMPGQTGEIKAIFNTNGKSVFSKTITVVSNAKSNATIQLTIMGTVVKPEDYKPPVKVEPAPAPAAKAKPATKKPAAAGTRKPASTPKTAPKQNKDAAKPKPTNKPVPTTGS